MKVDNTYKLISIAGNQNCYQNLIAILCFLFWLNVNILDFSLGFLENPSMVSFFDAKKNQTIVESIDYEICEWDKSEYTVVETYDFSWVIDLNIECDQLKVSIIGTLVSVGLLLGATTYSLITKCLGQKKALLTANAIFMVVLSITTFVVKYEYFCFTCVICPYMCNIISYSSMVLFSELISHQRKSIMNTLINSGLGLGGLFYVVMYYALREWKYVFIVCISISFVLEIMVIIFFFDSFEEYKAKKDVDGMLKALRFIAKMNGKLDSFNKLIETEEYQNILKELRDGQVLLPISTPRERVLDEIELAEMKKKENENNNHSNNKQEDILVINKSNNSLNENNDNSKSNNNNNNSNSYGKNVNETAECSPNVNRLNTSSSQNAMSKEAAKTNEIPKTKVGCTAILKYASVRWTFILFCVLWFFSTALYNGLTIGLKSLPGNIYLNSLLLFVAETPGYFVSGIAMNNDKLGRKYSLIMFTSVFAVTNLLLYIFFHHDVVCIVIYLITRFFVCCAFCIYYTYCLESYPLSVAQIAYGINGGCNCLGGIVVPFIIEYVEKRTLYLIYFIFACVCILLMIFLKETHNKPIPEQIKEIEEEEKKRLQGEIPVVSV